MLNVAGTQRAADAPASDLGETSAGIDRSDDRFKDLPRDATIKEQLGLAGNQLGSWRLESMVYGWFMAAGHQSDLLGL